MDEELERVCPENARGRLNARIDLLDERDHDENNERNGWHEVRQHDAGHRAREPGLIEHCRERDAEGDRRNKKRQQEEQHHKPFTRKVAPG